MRRLAVNRYAINLCQTFPLRWVLRYAIRVARDAIRVARDAIRVARYAIRVAHETRRDW